MVSPSRAAILELCSQAPVEHYPAGAVLMRQGEIGTYCLVILSGQVDIVAHSPSGETKRVASRGAGSVVGEYSLFEKERTASVITSAACTCARIPHAALLQMLNNSPPIAITFLAAALEKARETAVPEGFRNPA